MLPSITDLRARLGGLEAPAEPQPPVLADGPWFAAQTAPGCEVKALHAFSALGWAAFTPFGWKFSRARRARDEMYVMRRRVGLPGYVFMVAPRDRRGDLRVGEAASVLGVHRLVATAAGPLPIRAEAIALMRLAEAKGAYDVNDAPARGPLWEIQKGSQVAIVSGPFKGRVGRAAGRSTNSRVKVRDLVFGGVLNVRLDDVTPLDICRD